LGSASGGAGNPSPSATCDASSWSTWARFSTTRSRMCGRSTLPSSNWNAAAMCSFSQSLIEFQNSVAWL
jgi:hypothetical protein